MAEGTKAYKLYMFARAAIRARACLKQGVDVVHLHFSSGASSVRKTILARLAHASGAKVLMHAHGGGYRDYLSRISGPARRATVETLRRAHRLVVLGESWREFFVSVGVPRERVVVVPNPVARPAHLPSRAPRASVRFVYLGLVARQKGTFDLVEAVARLSAESRERVEVVIAGNGETERLRAATRARGLDSTIVVRDWIDVEERDALLASADALVLPSYAEGLPLSVLEAMAWGLPPICTPVGSVPEYVRHEVTGLLVEPGDIGQLASAIERMASHHGERRRMGERARAAVEPLAPERCAERLTAIYRSLAHGGAARCGDPR
jgi:glycosyltransferase involved in cell wall biosynthesis